MNVARRITVYFAVQKRYTLWTFIKYTEKSGDPAHARRLRNAMRKVLEQMVRDGKAVTCRSVKGGRAWRSRGDYPAGCPF